LLRNHISLQRGTPIAHLYDHIELTLPSLKMTLMKYFFLFAALIGMSVTSFAQNDAEAKKVLDAVSKKFKSYKTTQAGFNYKVEDASGKVLSSTNGTVSMKGNRYRVSFAGQEIFCDGTNVWTYDKNANEVTITKLDAAGSLTPQKLFTNFYDKDFLYKLNGEKKESGKVLQEIEMTPTDKSKPFHKVYLLVEKSTKNIFSTRVLEKNGGRYVYTVQSFKPNVAVADATFMFDKSKYPGVEVIDLR
jgi:chaperone LolA